MRSGTNRLLCFADICCISELYQPESYWDKVAENIADRRYGRQIEGDDEPYYHYKRKRFLALLATLDFSDKAVLEVGCGPGGNLDFIYNKGCKSITGTDVSGQMVALSKELVAGKNIDVIKTNGTDLPFEDGAFDVVFTSTVLQHITNELQLQKLSTEICRVAKGEVLLFERIESSIMGHESNVGRPVVYYENLLQPYGFKRTGSQALAIQASYYMCGAIRKLFNAKARREGESLSRVSVTLEKMMLPFTALLDQLLPSKRDVMMLRFEKITAS